MLQLKNGLYFGETQQQKEWNLLSQNAVVWGLSSIIFFC